ncbi:TetR family transcriptional regulator [Nocardia brasiliensis]|uniref:TetR family transcriptional regulator n=1 Tax=Nocardia brasiliensis TaxID=37326 RepID=A0A6G9XWK8_NOCBR|nr:TetR/AcrR family transcriptional regulator C-terminal domain-containing protein [Nocardia brasiliensis]QIS05213.1 TetR family transcriptional regulator [Nocardia brasiliensis]
MTKQFDSVWLREPRRPKASGLQREQIVAAAVELLDAEGLEALSMRKLGAKLGAGATSLYWYVANKNELLELALDEFWGMVETPEPDEVPWRELLSTFAYNFRSLLRAHPWGAALIGRLPSMGPKALRVTDRLRRGYTGAGFRGTDVYLASGAVMSYVLGVVLPEIAWRNSYGSHELDRASVVEMMEHAARDYPELRADFRKTTPDNPEFARAMAFDFGLLCVLDGLEARLRSDREFEQSYTPPG